MKKGSYYILEGRIEPSGASDPFFPIDSTIPGSLADAKQVADEYLRLHHRYNANLTWLQGSNGYWYARDLAITLRIRQQ